MDTIELAKVGFGLLDSLAKRTCLDLECGPARAMFVA
jgi:hypothetical protein